MQHNRLANRFSIIINRVQGYILCEGGFVCVWGEEHMYQFYICTKKIKGELRLAERWSNTLIFLVSLNGK